MKEREDCAKHNRSEATCYTWHFKDGEMNVLDVRQMRAMTEQMARLKRIIENQAVRIDILDEIDSKNSKPGDHAPDNQSVAGVRPGHRCSNLHN